MTLLAGGLVNAKMTNFWQVFFSTGLSDKDIEEIVKEVLLK